jgi:phosphotransferase system enzyme I (PtsI)
LLLIKDLPTETDDGKIIDLAANVELPSEIDSVIDHGAKSIGLCRTEFLFMLKPKLPEEEEQFLIYRNYLEKMKSGYVVIRTLDVGGDKMVASSSQESHEANPAMGFRAIRICLDDRNLFRTQLRAILRASVYGKLKIMFPMISTLSELREVLSFYRQVERELLEERVTLSSNIEVGTMIEVPAAAYCADSLAKEVDFFSIGTNDLAQFLLAVDRGNKKVAQLYDPLNPALLRTIQHIIDAGHRQSIWVGVCGEMAGHPLTALILLGMGVDELSMNPASILEIKKLFRSVSFDETRMLVRRALQLDTAPEIRLFFQRELRRKVNLASRLNSMFGI